MLNFPDLKMPVAIVTGGNKGIGLGVVSKILLFIIFVHFFIFVYLIFVGVVSISRTIIPKIHLCWIQIPESILAAAR